MLKFYTKILIIISMMLLGYINGSAQTIAYNLNSDIQMRTMAFNDINPKSSESYSSNNVITSETTTSSVAIGNQVWMKTNLDVSYYRNGDEIPQVQDPEKWANLTTGAWCYYENDGANGKVYGKLYNWYAVHDPRGLAPEGWHIPSDEEWSALVDFLGGEKIAGGKMKVSEGSVKYDFGAVLGGTRNDFKGKFYGMNKSGTWWSSTAVYGSYAWYRGLYYTNPEVNRNYLNKTIGFSVRCIKD